MRELMIWGVYYIISLPAQVILLSALLPRVMNEDEIFDMGIWLIFWPIIFLYKLIVEIFKIYLK